MGYSSLFSQIKLITGNVRLTKNTYIYKQNFKNNVTNISRFSKKNLNFDLFIDLKKPYFLTIINNRKILKSLFLKKTIKTNRLTKYIFKISQQNTKDYLYYTTFQVSYILSNTAFIVSQKDLEWLVCSKLVYLNFNVLKNIKYSLKKNDTLEFFFTKQHFNFLK